MDGKVLLHSFKIKTKLLRRNVAAIKGFKMKTKVGLIIIAISIVIAVTMTYYTNAGRPVPTIVMETDDMDNSLTQEELEINGDDHPDEFVDTD